MECLILAAGAGSRLHPLTSRLPKPMLPLAEGTILSRLVSQVSELPLARVLCNLYHHADLASEYLATAPLALPVVAKREEALRGPAGSLQTFHDEIAATDVVLVISGDVYMRGDLRALVRRHFESEALLTVLGVEVDDASRFGVFKLDASGQPTDLVEKPSWALGRRGWVSGGVYCVDPALLAEIPINGVYDFGQHLIPDLLRARRPVALFPWLGSWNDLGTLEAYRSTVLHDIELSGVPSSAGHFIYQHPEAEIHPTAELTGRVFVGHGARIMAGAQVYETVVFPGATVLQDAVVAGACLA